MKNFWIDMQNSSSLIANSLVMKLFNSKLQAFFYTLFCLSVFIPFSLIAQKKETSSIKGYGNASYTVAASEKYMRNWLIAGPFPVKGNTATAPDIEAQKKFFAEDFISEVKATPQKKMPPILLKEKEFTWQAYTSKEDIIDFDTLYKNTDFAAVYLLAEIKADSIYTAIFALGSDDGAKVWHNGKLIHQNWAARALAQDEDLIPITLVKGSNQLLIKVQDITGDWGFSSRILNKSTLSERLIAACRKGYLDEVSLILKTNPDLERKDASGLTPLNAAQLSGREEVITLLRQKGAKENPLPALPQLIEGMFRATKDQSVPGTAILVAKDGKVIYKNGFGYADIENKVLTSPETKFRIGSVTKQFTAAAILKLQEQGLLKVSDKLSKFFPDFPGGDEVSIHHLLTHTSGIHSYTGKADFYSKVISPVSSDSLIAWFKNDPYDFKPGEEFRYNNSGYFLLGCIIEKITGKSYDSYLKETFFIPLHMNNTGVHTSALSLEKEAKGYMKKGKTYEKALNWDMSWAGGAGALYSTVEDLYLWNEAVFKGKILNDNSMKAAFTPVVLNNGKVAESMKYGYGWIMSDYRGMPQISHSGGLHGFISQLARFPQENLSIVMLTNVLPANPDYASIAEFCLWSKMDKQLSYSAKTSAGKNMKEYEGRYDFSNGAVMTITAEDGQLFAQLSNQAKFPIFLSAEDEFFWKVVEAKIKFIRNVKGEVEYGEFTQNGNKINAQKLPDLIIVTVDPMVYKNYIGVYDYGNNFSISISTENGKLYAQGTNQPKLEILPLSEKDFIVKEINARLSFIGGQEGKIRLILEMGGQKLEAFKID
jgi:CubicO group peptidase (beta-lactamase class C family)